MKRRKIDRSSTLRADVIKYRPEVGKMKLLKNPRNIMQTTLARYSSYENTKFSFIG